MLVENQLIEVKWTNSNKEHFISKGYNYTKNKDKFYVGVDDLSIRSKLKVKVICDYCNSIFEKEFCNYIIEINKPISKCACSNCSGKKLSESLILKNKNKFQEFIAVCDELGYIPLSSEYINSRTPLKYYCEKHGVQNKKLSYIKQNGCEYCKKENKKKKQKIDGIKEFENICKKLGYTSLASIDDYENYHSYLPLMCPKHGLQYTTISNIKYKQAGGCHKCHMENIGNANKMTKDCLINAIESKNNNILLNPNSYENVSLRNLKIRCGSCNSIFIVSKNNYDKNTTGKCPNCIGKSIGEYLISTFLDEHEINYTRQEHFNGDCHDIKPLPFDFYLPNYNMCIEFDGQGHYEPVWGEESFLRTILHDGMKNNYCRWNNIKLLRIPYWDGNNIEDILVKELNLKPKHNKIVYIPTAQRKQNKTA